MSEAPESIGSRRHWPVYASYATAYAMLICFAAVFIQFLLWFSPTLDSRVMLFICALAILEAFFSFWLVKRLPTAQNQIAYYRITELIIMLVALKLFTELRAGPVHFWNNFLLWPVQFPFNILTSQYLLTVLPVLAGWWAANLFARDLDLLGTENAATLDDRFKTTPLRTVILRRFLSLGALAVLLAGIPSQNVFQSSMPVSSAGVPAVVAYFILGVILLSLTRYIVLESNWWEAKLHIPAQIPRRWFAYSALILAILVFLVSWLPTNSGLGLFATLNAVMNIIYQFSLFLFSLVRLVIALIASLFLKTPVDAQTQIQVNNLPPESLPLPNASPFNWALVRSIILWGSLIVLVAIAIRQYIAYNQDLAAELRRFRPLSWLIAAWDRIKSSIRKANKSVGAFIENSLQRLRRAGKQSTGSGDWEFINPRRLSPRQKVIFYYLALVRRAKEAGLPRQNDQTPYEYARSLSARLKEGKEDVDAMTASFIEARYSRHDIPPKAARRVESIWETIRKVLQNVRRTRQE